MQLRELIIYEARSWIGTDFHHQGRIKKTNNHNGGCDCIGLIMGIAEKFSLKSKLGDKLKNFDRTNYPKIAVDQLADFMHSHFVETEHIDSVNLILFKIGKYLQHIAIADINEDNKIYIIHSHISCGKVVKHLLDEYWQDKIYKIYEFVNLTKKDH